VIASDHSADASNPWQLFHGDSVTLRGACLSAGRGCARAGELAAPSRPARQECDRFLRAQIRPCATVRGGVDRGGDRVDPRQRIGELSRTRPTGERRALVRRVWHRQRRPTRTVCRSERARHPRGGANSPRIGTTRHYWAYFDRYQRAQVSRIYTHGSGSWPERRETRMSGIYPCQRHFARPNGPAGGPKAPSTTTCSLPRRTAQPLYPPRSPTPVRHGSRGPDSDVRVRRHRRAARTHTGCHGRTSSDDPRRMLAVDSDITQLPNSGRRPRGA
jgi:hypothetical protein